MDRATRILFNQLITWSRQYNLELLPEFKELIQSDGTFPVNRVKGLYGAMYNNGKLEEPSIAYEFSLLGAKEVKVKECRRCKKCGYTIQKGDKAITTSKVIKGKGHRYWFHPFCAYEQLMQAEKISAEIRNAEEPDWDDGKSSNGL